MAQPAIPTERSGRVPPHDLEAEKAVLSAVLLDNTCVNEVQSELRPEDFYHPAHQQLFRAMMALHDSSQPVDLHTLSDHLNQKKLLDSLGGPVFLAEIADYEATAANVVHHARIVRDKSVKRGLIAVAGEIAESAFDQADSYERLLDAAEHKVLEIGRERGRVAFRALEDELHVATDHVDALMERGGELTGVPTGFTELDQATGGLQPGELIVIAARPSMGKTALALNIARNAAVDHGKKVAIFSLEMNKLSLVLRLMSSEARVSMTPFRRGFGSAESYKRLTDAANRLTSAKIWIDDTGMIRILELKAKCRRLAAQEGGLDLVMLDYLQLAHGDTPHQRKDLEIAEISAGLKALAKELNIPVIALSQLNRGPEQRDPDKRRPNMGDLRESGAIEQDADLISFIYRDEVYNRKPENEGKAELIVAKQRNGPTGTIELQFESRYACFRNLDHEDRPEFDPTSDAGFVLDSPPPPEDDFL